MELKQTLAIGNYIVKEINKVAPNLTVYQAEQKPHDDDCKLFFTQNGRVLFTMTIIPESVQNTGIIDEIKFNSIKL